MIDATVLLQPLFPAPIREATSLDPGYVSHASDVWLVRTDTEEVVVRACRATGPLRGPFSTGCRRLFGTDPRCVWELEGTNATLADLSPVRVPRVLRRGKLGDRQCVLVERMPGNPLQTFIGAPLRIPRDLGLAVAHIHQRTYPWCGSLTGRVRVELPAFGAHLAATMRTLCGEYRPELRATVEEVCQAVPGLPTPAVGTLVLPDLDATQFLAQDGRLTALVDTEYACVGPRELDFVALEYVLDAPAAAAFREAYASVLPLPVVGPVRRVYRLLYLLLEVQGRRPLGQWLPQPALFA